MLPQNVRLAEGGRFKRPSRRATPVFGTGYALSPSIIDDIIFASCIVDGVFNLFAVNQRLHDNGAKIIPPV